MLKKLKNTVTEFCKSFRTVWLEYEKEYPTDYKKVLIIVVSIILFVLLAAAFKEPIAAIVRCLCYSVALLIVVAPTVTFLRGMYHKYCTPSAPSVYPVYFGHNGVCWNIENIDKEFHEIESCFQTCYPMLPYEQVNTIEYYFRFLPKREMPVSYELIQLIQRMGEKMAARKFQQIGLSGKFENVVACDIKGECLRLMFAKNEKGIISVTSMQNIVYHSYHMPQYQADPTMEETMEDDI